MVLIAAQLKAARPSFQSSPAPGGRRYATPGAKPYSQEELAGSPTKRVIDQGMKGPTINELLAQDENRTILSAYEVAKAGGAYAKVLSRYRGERLVRLERAVRSFNKVITEHESWIDDPFSKLEPGTPQDAVDRYVGRKWPSDIRRAAAQRDVLMGLIDERKRKNGKNQGG